MSKGSKRRPMSVKYEEYLKKWEKIFDKEVTVSDTSKEVIKEAILATMKKCGDVSLSEVAQKIDDYEA